MLDALLAEHQPAGPIEEHSVEELGGILWRKRRLRLAEMATYRLDLPKTLAQHRVTAKADLAHLHARNPERVVGAVGTIAVEKEAERAEIPAEEAMTRHAVQIQSSHHNDAYEPATLALREDTQ